MEQRFDCAWEIRFNGGVARESAAPKPEEQAQHKAHENHGREWDVQTEPRSLDQQVAWQAAERQLGEPWPEQTKHCDCESGGNEQALHRVSIAWSDPFMRLQTSGEGMGGWSAS
jgi:hypothetical protein